MDKYQWTSTGMSITAVENGPMRYIREVDYDALQAKVDELTKLCQARSQKLINANRCIAALKQEQGETIDDLVERIKPR